MNRVKFTPAPIEGEERALVFRRELGAVAEGDAGRRTGADVHNGAAVVGIELGPLARAVAPAELRTADHVVDARGPIPRGVEVILHVGVVGEELAFAIHGTVEDIAETGGVGLERFSIRRETIDDAAGREHVAHEAAAVGHAGQQVILAPVARDRRSRSELRGLGAVAGNKIQCLAIGRRHDRVDAVVAARLDGAEELDLVEAVVAIAVGDAVDAALDLALVVVDTDVERAERERHAVDRADHGGHLLDGGALQRLAGRGRREAVEPAVLIARVDAATVIGAEIDPRALLDARHGVNQLDGEAGRDLQAADRRGLVFADCRTDDSGRGGGSFFLCGLSSRSVATAERGDDEDTEDADRNSRGHKGEWKPRGGKKKTWPSARGYGRPTAGNQKHAAGGQRRVTSRLRQRTCPWARTCASSAESCATFSGCWA